MLFGLGGSCFHVVGFIVFVRNANPLQNLTSTTVEVTIPQMYLSHVYGENSSNLVQIRQVCLYLVTQFIEPYIMVLRNSIIVLN